MIGEVDHPTLFDRLINGVNTSDGIFSANLLESRPTNSDETVNLSTLIGMVNETDDLNENSYRNSNNNNNNSNSTISMDNNSSISFVRLSVTEGKYRMVRRYSTKLLIALYLNILHGIVHL